MAEKLDPLIPKLMCVAFGSGSTDTERWTAVGRIRQCLKNAGSDVHDLVKLIEKAPLSEDEMKEIFEAGYNKRQADEIEEKASKRTSFFSSNGSSTKYSFNSSSSFNGTGKVRGSDAFNGYRMLDIARYCAQHINSIPDKHREFVEKMADQLGHHSITEKQARYLGNLFKQHFSGRIE